MSQAQDFVTAFMEQLAGSATLNETLKGVFASILEKQVSVSAENEVSFGSSFSVLAQVFTFIATPEADRPSEGILGYGDAAIDQAKTDAATDQGLTVGGDITPATFSMSASATEAEEGKELTFTITASTPVTEDTAVTFQIVTDGKDASDEDFQQSQLSQTATILAGETTATFSVNPQRDGLNEDSESFGVSATVGGETFTADATILDVDSKEFVLTTGRDIETANIFYASQTQFDVDGKGPTLQSNDILTGFADEDDNKLVVEDLTPNVSNSNLPTGLQLNNIQTVELNSTGNTAGSGLSTIPHASVTTLTANTDGGSSRDLYLANNANTGTETTVNVTQTSFANAAGVTVSGGHDVTVTSNGGAGVRVGNQNSSSVPTDGQVTTGDVNITTNSTGGTAAIQVYGGKDVNVTTTSSSHSGNINIGNTTTNTGNSSAGSLANASGDITINSKGSGTVNIMGGDNVVVNQDVLSGTATGALTIGDAGYVTPSNLATGDVTVTQNASITYNGLAGSTNNQQQGGAIDITGGANITIDTNLSNVMTIGDRGATQEDALNPTGTVTVTNTGVETATASGAIQVAGGTDVTVETTGSNVTIGGGINSIAARSPSGDVEVTQTMNGAGLTRSISIDGGDNVTVNAKGQNVAIGTDTVSGRAPTGEVIVNQNDIFTGKNNAVLNGTNAGDITVNGGTDVTINTTGGDVSVGNTVAGENTVPSGAVTVNNTFGGVGGDDVTVKGGTTVDITTTQTGGDIAVGDAAAVVLNAAGTELKDANLAPTGNVTIVNKTVSGDQTAYGKGNVDVHTNGATTVNITGGDVDSITDIQSTLATGGSNAGKAVGTSTLTDIVIDNQQNSGGGSIAIASDALTNLTITNQNIGTNTDTVTITNNTDAHALNITQGGNAKGTTQIVDAKAGTITVNDNGTDSAQTLRIDAAKATSVTLNNSAAAKVDLGQVASDIATVTLTGAGATTLSAGGAAFGTGNLSDAMTVDASAATGNVTASMSMTTVANKEQSYKGGAGVDTVTISTNASGWSSNATIDGGNGDADVLVADYAASGTDVALGNAANVKGFEVLKLGASADSTGGNYDSSGFTTVQVGAIAGDVAFSNAATGLTLDVLAETTNNRTVTVNGANYTATNTAMTVNLSNAGASTGAITVNGIESLAVNAVANSSSTINGVASNGQASLTVGGSKNLTLTSDMGFTSIDASSNTGTAVNVSDAKVSNAGVTFTGGAGKLTATGSNDSGNVKALVTIAGTGASPIANGETVVVTVSDSTGANGGTYTYTNGTGSAVTVDVAATSIAAAINAAATTGSTALSANAGNNNAGITATASGGNIVLSANAVFEVQTSDTAASGTVTDSLLGGQQVNQVTLTEVGGDLADGETFTITINGTTYTTTAATPGTGAAEFATASGVSAAATNLAAQITAANESGIASAVASNGVVTISSQIGQTNLISAATTGASDTAVDASTVLMNTVNNVFTTGAGGGEYKAGLGGSFSTVTKSFGSGSETVNLTASAAKSDTLVLKEGAVVTDNGTQGGVTGFTVGSQSASDTLVFRDTADSASQAKTIVANTVAGNTVSTLANASNMAAVFDSTGALNTKLANLTYSISNGVITFGATGGNSLSQFTVNELINAAQMIVSSSTTGGADKVAAFSHGGKSYVVASDSADTGAAGASTLGESTGAGSDTKNAVVELKDVASVKGFGMSFGENTIVSNDVAYINNDTVDLAALAASSTLDYTGFVIAEMDNLTADATANTTINNLASFGVLHIEGASTGSMGYITVDQVGAAGQNSLLTVMETAAKTVERLTTNDAGLVQFSTANAAQTVKSLVDANNTMNTIKVTGSSAFTLEGVTSTALTTVDTTSAGAAVTLGNGSFTSTTNYTVTEAIAQNNLTFNLSTSQSEVIFTSGTGNTFTQGTGTGAVQVVASGSSNTITLSNGANEIVANGAGNTITVGTGANAIVATGADATFNVASGAATVITVGTNATVNIGTANTANAGAETIKVIGAATGGDSSDFAKTTITFASGVSSTSNIIDFSGNAVNFSLLGANTAQSQVNVASATTLEEALNMAANYTLLTQDQGTAASTADLATNTAAVSWMQYDGNTYVVAMVNDSGAGVQQTGLDSNDIVVKLTGLQDLSASTFAAEALTL